HAGRVGRPRGTARVRPAHDRAVAADAVPGPPAGAGPVRRIPLRCPGRSDADWSGASVAAGPRATLPAERPREADAAAARRPLPAACGAVHAAPAAVDPGR